MFPSLFLQINLFMGYFLGGVRKIGKKNKLELLNLFYRHHTVLYDMNIVSGMVGVSQQTLH